MSQFLLCVALNILYMKIPRKDLQSSAAVLNVLYMDFLHNDVGVINTVFLIWTAKIPFYRQAKYCATYGKCKRGMQK